MKWACWKYRRCMVINLNRTTVMSWRGCIFRLWTVDALLLPYTWGASASARYSRAAATPKALRRCQVDYSGWNVRGWRFKVLYCSNSLQDVINPTYPGPHKATTNLIESPARKTRQFKKMGQKCKVLLLSCTTTVKLLQRTILPRQYYKVYEPAWLL